MAARKKATSKTGSDAINPAEHTGLAWKLARRQRNDTDPAVDLEDVAQQAMLGVCRAAQTYDPKRARFSTYAWQGIRNAIAELNHRRAKRAQMVEATEAVAARLVDRGTADPVSFERAELCAKLLACLDARSRVVVEMRTRGMTLQAIGDQIGLSKERIRQIFDASVQAMRIRARELGECVDLAA